MFRRSMWLAGTCLAALIGWSASTGAAEPLAPPAPSATSAPPQTPNIAADKASPPIISPAAETQPPIAATQPSSTPSGGEPLLGQTQAAEPAPTALQQALASFAASGPARMTIEAKRRREAEVAYYAAHDDKPLWLADGEWTAAAKAVVDRLNHADADGLSPAALAIPKLTQGDSAAKAAAELALSDAVVLFGEQASGGRVDLHKIVAQIGDPHSRMEPAEILSKVASSANPAQALDEFDPPQPGFKALARRLADLRAGASASARSAQPIPNGPVLRKGMRDPRAPLLRERLGLVPAVGADADIYDGELAAAVAEFQRSAGLPADGVLTARAVAALSGGSAGGSASAQEAEILANMEMWRWSPRDMGADRIEVNIPDFSLTLFRSDKPVRRTRVVVGKATTPTPLFSNIVRFAVVNPSWDVPQSIVKKEMLPKYAANPNYFAQNGYVVTRKGDTLEVRQPPGDRNALGRIKFLFPNDYDVYLHDTPERQLFSATVRDFSHGCVRVQDPFALGQDILGGDWSEERLKKLIGAAEHTIRVPAPLPIHIEYFTAWIDDAGKLQTRPDVYGYMRKVERALGYSS